MTKIFAQVLTPSLLAFALLQGCGSGTGFDSDDLQAADEALGAEDEAPTETPECAIPSVCQLCDDGSCATPNVEIVDGKCGPVTYSCEGTATSNPGDGPGAPTSSPPNPGQAGTTPPSAADCPVPAICQLCDDGGCATPHVELVNGECGPLTFSCDGATGGSTAGPVNPPSVGDCPVPAICQLCDDGSCATAEVEFEDGECGAVHFACPESVEGSGPDAGADAGSNTHD